MINSMTYKLVQILLCQFSHHKQVHKPWISRLWSQYVIKNVFSFFVESQKELLHLLVWKKIIENLNNQFHFLVEMRWTDHFF